MIITDIVLIVFLIFFYYFSFSIQRIHNPLKLCVFAIFYLNFVFVFEFLIEFLLRKYIICFFSMKFEKLLFWPPNGHGSLECILGTIICVKTVANIPQYFLTVLNKSEFVRILLLF